MKSTEYSFTYNILDTRDNETFEITCTRSELENLLNSNSYFALDE